MDCVFDACLLYTSIQLYLSMQKAKYDDAFGIAVVLLVIVLGINFLAKYLTRKFDVTKLK